MRENWYLEEREEGLAKPIGPEPHKVEIALRNVRTERVRSYAWIENSPLSQEGVIRHVLSLLNSGPLSCDCWRGKVMYPEGSIEDPHLLCHVPTATSVIQLTGLWIDGERINLEECDR